MSGKRRNLCIVSGCKNKGDQPRLPFFKLPNDEERRNIWLSLINRLDLLEKDNLRPASYIVCAVHFEPNMILYTPKLSPDAIPTKNLPGMQDNPKYTEDLETGNMNAKTQTETHTDTPTKIIEETHRTVEVQTKADTRDSGLQTNIDSSAVTLKDSNLLKRIKDTERNQRALANDLKRIEKEFKAKESNLNLEFIDYSNDEVVKKFHKLIQWRNDLSKNLKGNKMDAKLESFALNLRVSSPEMYRTVQSLLKLPSEKVLKRIKLQIPPTVEDRILDYLTSKLKSLPLEAKYCVLCIDEVVLKKHLYYDTRQDYVTGLHNIHGEVMNKVASSACVAMLRGITVDWTQPLAYSLLASAKHYETIEIWINELISTLSNVGIEVMAIVTNQEANYDKLAKNTKNITVEKPYFDFNGRKIYYIFDVPHLITSLRNELVANSLYNFKLISWHYLNLLWSNQTVKDLGLIPKITNAHINPNEVQKKQVIYAAQVFSLSVVSALKILMCTKNIPKEAEATVNFVETINNLFDLLNSDTLKSSNKYKAAFAFKHHQLKLLLEALEMFRTITFVDASDRSNKVNTFLNFQISIQAILMLSRDLKEMGFNHVLTRRLNKEPLDNMLDSIRIQKGTYSHPTPIRFVRAFSKHFLSNMLKKSPAGHFQEDMFDLLQKGDELFTQQIPIPFRSKVDLGGETDYRFDVPSENGIVYIAAYLLYKCAQEHMCSELAGVMLELADLDETKLFVHYGNLNENAPFFGSLKLPEDSFIAYVKELDTLFVKYFDKMVTEQPASTLFYELKGVNHAHACPCFPEDYLLKLFVRFRIYETLKDNNKSFRRRGPLTQDCIIIKEFEL